jgi:hypothetical protein
MSYRRFKLGADLPSSPRPSQTVAGVATVAAADPAFKSAGTGTVATVASVAAGPAKADGPFAPDFSTPTPATLATVATLSDLGVTEPHVVEAYERFLVASHRPAENLAIAQRFLRDHFEVARRLGWTNRELFGCHTQPAFAPVRFDCMGAVTLAVLTGSAATTVAATEMRYEDGLASRRNRLLSLAAPVWTAFPPPSR